jgi:hypothetical protein
MNKYFSVICHIMLKHRTTNAVNRMRSNHLDTDINMLLLSEIIQTVRGLYILLCDFVIKQLM